MFTLTAVGCKREASPADERAPVRVAAAADLTLAFEQLGRVFEREARERVTFSFGSTGLLAKQIREGAPFDLFAAANVSFVEQVVAAGSCDAASQAPYARGRIALCSIILPLSRHGVLAGVTLGFARTLGDVGVTLMVAGNIPGLTQTGALAIAATRPGPYVADPYASVTYHGSVVYDGISVIVTVLAENSPKIARSEAWHGSRLWRALPRSMPCLNTVLDPRLGFRTSPPCSL